MGTLDRKQLSAALNKLQSGASITLDQVLSFAWSSIKAHGKRAHKCELEAVEAIREEVGRLQPLELSARHLPSAKEELDIAVKATEEAADKILSCAETVLALDARGGKAYAASVNKAMLEILEACAFQDISGQHISKAAETLHRVDIRLTRFAKASGVRDWEGAATECEEAKNKRKEDLILHGPATNGDGLGQNDIDALLAG